MIFGLIMAIILDAFSKYLNELDLDEEKESEFSNFLLNELS